MCHKHTLTCPFKQCTFVESRVFKAKALLHMDIHLRLHHAVFDAEKRALLVNKSMFNK